jgi:hypothetical protein
VVSSAIARLLGPGEFFGLNGAPFAGGVELLALDLDHTVGFVAVPQQADDEILCGLKGVEEFCEQGGAGSRTCCQLTLKRSVFIAPALLLVRVPIWRFGVLPLSRSQCLAARALRP